MCVTKFLQSAVMLYTYMSLGTFPLPAYSRKRLDITLMSKPASQRSYIANIYRGRSGRGRQGGGGQGEGEGLSTPCSAFYYVRAGEPTPPPSPVWQSRSSPSHGGWQTGECLTWVPELFHPSRDKSCPLFSHFSFLSPVFPLCAAQAPLA